MMRCRIGFLCAVVGLSGCDHHPTESGAAAVADTDSAYTGEKPGTASTSYPRALPVTAASQKEASTKAEAVSSADVSTPPDQSQTIPPRSPVPEPTETAAMPAAASPESARASSSTSVPAASTPETATEAPHLEMNPPTPVVATTPPVAMTDTEAQKQVVVLDTTLGRIVIELDDVSAPRTCGNFRKLVSDKFYDHTVFHRVIPHFMIQGGDPNSKSDDRSTYGQGDPGYTLPAEIRLPHTTGAVAMARLPDGVNPQRESNGSQFYICVAACPSLDGQYTVFGHVIRGMDVANKIANQPRDPRDNPTTRVEMEAHLEPKKLALEESGT